MTKRCGALHSSRKLRNTAKKRKKSRLFGFSKKRKKLKKT